MTDALEDATAHQALDLAKAGAWPRLYTFLDDYEQTLGHGVLVNARPEGRKYGCLHHAAWHGEEAACTTLVRTYGADATALTQNGELASDVAEARGHEALAVLLRKYEAAPHFCIRTDALEDATAQQALDLAKAGAWPSLYTFLDDYEQTLGHGVLVNARPEGRKYGCLHHAAWHGKATACTTLVRKYGADAKALTQNGELASDVAEARGHEALVVLLRKYEQGDLGGTPVRVSICLPSGDFLLQDAQVYSDDMVASLMNLAGQALHDAGDEKDVLALCAADGTMLSSDPTQSLAEAHVEDGAMLTAVLVDDAAALETIERLFHNLIMYRNGCLGRPQKLERTGFEFPSLKALVADHGEAQQYYAVPGMYGGFSTVVAKEASGWVLRCSSWCRICEGSEEDHVITVDGVKEIRRGVCVDVTFDKKTPASEEDQEAPEGGESEDQ